MEEDPTKVATMSGGGGGVGPKQQQQDNYDYNNHNYQPLTCAAELLFANTTIEAKLYWDRSHYDSPESQMKALTQSSTLYIGNLAFSTRSYHVLSHFSQIGPVQKVIMGLDRFHHTPCGFCFVEYVERDDALSAIANLNATKLDGRVIRVELDAGFQAGRQFGRGASGGQVRDDRRQKQDPGRNKRMKPLAWTPPEHVRQQQQQQQQQQQPPSMGSGGEVDGALSREDGMMTADEKFADAEQETNPRFRGES
jgi:nuclear cap-binding protein subunit 2